MFFLKSLQWRLVCLFIAVSIALMIVVWVFSTRGIVSSYYTTFKEGIESGFKSLDKSGSLPSHPSSEEIKKIMDENIRSFYIIGDNRSYSIIDKKMNRIIFSSAKKDKENESEFTDEIFKSQNLLKAMVPDEETTGDEAKLTYYDGGAFFDYAKPVGNYVIYFRYDREDWEDAIRKFNNVILASCFFAIIASLIIGYILSKTITAPIVRLMHKARRIAAGDFDQVVEVKSRDEIGKLTNAFNHMARELKKTISEVSSEKNKIETILNYMTDGVIAFSQKGGVIHANPAAARMLGVSGVNENFNEFSVKYNMGLTLEDILYIESSSSKESSVKVNDRFIKVYFAAFTGEDKKVEGIIAVLHDVTEQQKLEGMRREFVANVSHELRTPITSIKSYTETLLDGALEDRETTERFLNVINSESDRMTRLVKDLLQLSRLDNMQMQWKVQEVSFVEIVKGVVEKMQIEAKNKNQLLECFVIGDIPKIQADRDRIEQVIVNIVINAIKYTPDGGKITVYIGEMFGQVYAKVADTGIGIPEADLPRIFERFYRVDKARSREMGGTGLGLAIAKEIVEAHGGSITVASEKDKGTEMTVKLPVAKSSGYSAEGEDGKRM